MEIGRDGRIILKLILDQYLGILSNWFRWSSLRGGAARE
jgi:hypothetical protein